ncbi:MAG: HIT domain-containing protein [Chloroflexota bacterium]|nr:HIT domain-containing protein [Chloroflexota bacterium]
MTSAKDCIFCKIASGEARAERVIEDDRLVAFKDAHPRGPLHVLVIPRDHINSLADMDDEPLIGHLFATAARIAKDAGYSERGFRVFANAGADGGQLVPHLHVHVVAGRRLGDPA